MAKNHLDFFDAHFTFSPLHLSIISKIANDTGMSEDVIKKYLRYVFRRTYHQLNSEDDVLINFKHFKLLNFQR